MISRLELTAWKGFREYSIEFNRHSTTLIGPNNAGKSTIVGALRLCASLIEHANRRPAGDTAARRAGRPNAYAVTQADLESAAFTTENLLHEFRSITPSLNLTLSTGAELRLDWVVDEADLRPPDRGFFTFTGRRRTDQDQNYSIGVVPTLSPLEASEVVLTDRRIRGNFTTRLASAHFRNQLFWVHERNHEWKDLENFILQHTPEIAGLGFDVEPTGRGSHTIDVYFEEAGTLHQRELIWAGDGLQIWLQILFHLWRERERSTIVLDEPDVYLHPDLQRRLARLLSRLDKQVVVASHSLELLAELGPDTAVAVDRSVTQAKRLAARSGFQVAADIVGSGLAFGVARAFTKPVVLCVEGKDRTLISRLATALGYVRLAGEQGVAPVSLHGFSDYHRVLNFAKMMQQLDYTGTIIVLLDRDYRDQRTVAEVVGSLREVGVRCYVWQRKELENYLLVPELVARVAGITLDQAERVLLEVTDLLHEDSKTRWVEQRFRLRDKSLDEGKVMTEAIRSFDAAWSSRSDRVALVPGKSAIAKLSHLLQTEFQVSVSSRRLASEMKSNDAASEVKVVLGEIESLLGQH